jgi:hypothetical protein
MPGVPGELSRSRSMHAVKIDPDHVFVNCENLVDEYAVVALAFVTRARTSNGCCSAS